MGGSRIRAVVAGLAVVAGACGSGDPDVVTEPAGDTVAPISSVTSAAGVSSTTPATNPDRAASVLPSVTVTDVRSGAAVDVATLVPAKEPTLLWFWAPH